MMKDTVVQRAIVMYGAARSWGGESGAQVRWQVCTVYWTGGMRLAWGLCQQKLCSSDHVCVHGWAGVSARLLGGRGTYVQHEGELCDAEPGGAQRGGGEHGERLHGGDALGEHGLGGAEAGRRVQCVLVAGVEPGVRVSG